MNDNFDRIRCDGRLLYEYIRGSHLYGLNTPTSDVDTSGLYISDIDNLFNVGLKEYHGDVSDNKHDNTWFEIGKFMNMLTKSNPTVFEALFADDEHILTKPHALLSDLFSCRNEFLTKDCFKSFIGYSTQQIHKARGLNKKIVNPIYERKEALDFVYTFISQGSMSIIKFLKNYSLYARYCGVSNIPHMQDMYCVFYDWGLHLSERPNDKDKLSEARSVLNKDREKRYKKIEEEPILHYRGLVDETANHQTQLRLSSIEDKLDLPICRASFNSNGYQEHCKKYKEYKEWEKLRNPSRYESNLDKTYDSKNMMHCFRLIHMGKEIADGNGVNLKRTWDKEFLMDVRNHKYEYDDLMSILDKDKEEMLKSMSESTLKEHIDIGLVNDLLVSIRKKFYIKNT